MAIVSYLFILSLPVALKAQSNKLPQPDLITDRQGLPQGFVSGIVQDQQGFIWVATRDGLCRYDGNTFKVFRPQFVSKSSVKTFSDLRSLQIYKGGKIWITTEQAQIAQFDPKTEVFTNYSPYLFSEQLPYPLVIRHYLHDRQNRLWVAIDGQGLICLNLTNFNVKRYRHQPTKPTSLGSDYVRYILEDRQGRIWFATASGLERYVETADSFQHHISSTSPLSLPENDLHSLFLRPTGDILIGATQHVALFDPQTGKSRSYRLPAVGETLWGIRFASDSKGTIYFDQRSRLYRFSEVQGPELLASFTRETGFCTSLFIDQSDVLWLGTDGLGIRKFDLRSFGFRTARYRTNFQIDLFTDWLHVSMAQSQPIRLNDPYMFRYTLDKQGGIWANVGSSAFYYVNPTTRQAQISNFPVEYVQTVSPMATDEQGLVWVLYSYQFWFYDAKQRRWVKSPYQLDRSKTQEVVQIVADQQAFWVATLARGLFRLDRQSGQLTHYQNNPNRLTTLSGNELICMSADPANRNRLWIGTYGNGLCCFDKRTGTARRINEQDGLPNLVVYSAIPDQLGYLWVGTNKGLCRIDRKSFNIRTYTTEDGLLANEFNRFHYLKLPDDRIIMGGVEGITGFRPTQLVDDRFEPNVEFTSLLINNKVVNQGKDSLLSQPIQALQSLTLPYDKNFINLQFAALQFNRPGKNKYRYRLEGIDPNWVESNQPQAIYTALPSGSYSLLVNASNTSGYWSHYTRKLQIQILPPWWATWWAWLIYSIIVLGSIWYGIRLYLNRLWLQQTIELRQQEAIQLKELDLAKSNFFTNITHDFRTPLTLILSPMDGLIQETIGTTYEKRLKSIRQNARQLLDLINQLLDFSKLDVRMLTVDLSRGNVTDFIKQTLDLFAEEALSKNITITLDSELTTDYWFDTGKLERILTNLIANALTYTPATGRINVSVQDSGVVRLIVSDTGIGIAPEKLPHIFDRFYQAGDESQERRSVQPTKRKASTGIGLALVQELVHLQHGEIDVKSEVGKGTSFTVSLPYRAAVAEEKSDVSFSATPQRAEQIEVLEQDETPHILLVEDNPELADFIADSLPSAYRISRAANGEEGVQMALAELPDLVISDVMMPIMDGYTLCRSLKHHERTNHIPIILLTAKATFANKLEGLEQGADDYLTKPFHVQELILRIHNLLERQRHFQLRVQAELVHTEELRTEASPPIAENTERQHPFLEKLYAFIEDHLADSAVSVEGVAEAMHMSRVHLHRKVKALTGLSTGEVIRNYRLKRATNFLKEGLNSSETAFRVGFESPAYFSKCFRELYGKTPLEFAGH